MKRVRLDIGAFNASPNEEGGFMFFLYREEMKRCLPISLTPPDMHALLANFRNLEGEAISSQRLLYSTLQDFRIELLEITIVKQNEADAFMSRLLFFDGEKEILRDASFTDGVILSKFFGCPIYISEKLMAKYATDIAVVSEEKLKTESYREELKADLEQAIRDEDYERAIVLNKEIANFEK